MGDSHQENGPAGGLAGDAAPWEPPPRNRRAARRPAPAATILRRNLWIYGVGGILIPFAGIKVLDMLITLLHPA